MDISVVVPFYKGNRYMERIFRVIRENALNVPESEIELIIVNDSPEYDVEYENAWIDERFTLKIVKNPRNLGIHGSRVQGIRVAEGEFVQLLDQDDILMEDAFASQLAVIGEGDLVVANGYDESEISPGPIYESLSQQRMVLEEKYYYSIGNMIPSPGQCLLRKTIIPSEWLDNPIHCNGSDDLLLWLLLFKTKCKWKINEKQLYVHVNTGTNFSMDFQKMRQSSEEVLYFLKERNMISAGQEKKFVRRFNMRALYEGKGKIAKIKAMLLFPDLMYDLLMKRLRKGS